VWIIRQALCMVRRKNLTPGRCGLGLTSSPPSPPARIPRVKCHGPWRPQQMHNALRRTRVRTGSNTSSSVRMRLTLYDLPVLSNEPPDEMQGVGGRAHQLHHQRCVRPPPRQPPVLSRPPSPMPELPMVVCDAEEGLGEGSAAPPPRFTSAGTACADPQPPARALE
jgi:hypothetical protein